MMPSTDGILPSNGTPVRTFWSLILVSAAALLILWLLQDPPSDQGRGMAFDHSPRTPAVETNRPPVEPMTTDPDTSAPPATESTIATEVDSQDGLEDQLRTSAEQRPDLPSLDLEEPDADLTTDTQKTGLTLGMDKSIPHATITPGTIIRTLPDQLEVDGEFTLKGSGTQEDPYLPSWDYLFSAGTTYKPRIGKDALPQRIALLDGAWVTISGNTAFPLVVGESSEMLVMLNQWDGCCIGVPPTPFDAIEVRLQRAVKTGPKHSFNYGTVTGRMKVDPYLIEDWLVGLYILEEADLVNDL